LAVHRIAWLGIDTVASPYRRVRLSPSGSFFLACLEGEGQVLLEGRWQRVGAGSLCLAPPAGAQCVSRGAGSALEVCVGALRGAGRHGTARGRGFAAADADGRGGVWARGGGAARRVGRRARWVLTNHWVSLVHGHARRLARPWRGGSRVGALWEKVVCELAAKWKLATLAAACAVSAEHLRRLCRRELGRTPMEHVTYMRVHRAQELLAETNDKLDAIAPQVGYHSAVVFSRAFVRCAGMTPTEYRERGKKA